MVDEVQPAIEAISAASAPSSEETPAVPRYGVWSRLIGVLRDETAGLHLRLRLAHVLTAPLPHFTFVRLRTAIYRAVGVQIGPGSLLLGAIELAGPGRVHTRFTVGRDSQITAPLYADVSSPIRIGDRVYIGHHAKLITTNHEIGPPQQRCGSWRSAPIVIEDGAWIGAGALILPGVTVGHGAVVAAGAVVTRDVPPDTLVGGIPARVLRPLEPGTTE